MSIESRNLEARHIYLRYDRDVMRTEHETKS